MRIAILGHVNPSTTYRDWVLGLRRNFRDSTILKISITSGDTLLNSYVKQYADDLSIPVTVYNMGDYSDNADPQKARNIALVKDADLVLVFSSKGVLKSSDEIRAGLKKALIVNADEQSKYSKIIASITMQNINESSREELLTVEEEVALVRKVQASGGDADEAMRKILLANRRFLRKVAQRYVVEDHTIDELMEEGCKGLIQAVKKFDPTKGFKLISYAVWWIRGSIKDAVSER